jgi:prepilin-type N-terminal cleavage/methylation domain-containing protein
MRLIGSSQRRRGLTLLEVLIATAIFLIALGGLTQLLSVANNASYEAKVISQAAHLAQTKLAELRAGILGFQSVSDQPLDDDPTFNWSLEVGQGPAPNLSLATVRVYRLRPNRTPIQVELSEYVLSPEQFGSTMDVGPVLNNQSAPESGDSGSTDPNASSGGMTGGGAGMTGGGGPMGGAMGGATGGRGGAGGAMGGATGGGRGGMTGGAMGGATGGGRGAGGAIGGGMTGGGRGGAAGGAGGATGGGRGAGKGG